MIPIAALLVLLAGSLGGCAVWSGAASPATAARVPEPLDPPPQLEWRPPGTPAAVILALHGSNDQKASFAGFATFASAHGLALRAYDQPGFGAQPDRGRWPGIRRLVTALRAEIVRTQQAYPGIPVYVMGESMGAAVAVVALAGPDAPTVAGLVASAPAVWGGDTLAGSYRVVLRIATLLAPRVVLTGRRMDVLASDDIAALLALGRDPLYLRGVRIEAVGGLVALMDEARRRAPDLKARTLVLIGARDELVPPAVQESFTRIVGAPDCTAVIYPDGWHLLLRDLQRAKVFTDITAWMGGQRLPSGLDRSCRVEAGQPSRARQDGIWQAPAPVVAPDAPSAAASGLPVAARPG